MKVKPDQRRSLIIACIYRSQSTTSAQNESNFNKIKRQTIEIIQPHTTSMVVIHGDFNADPETNSTGAIKLDHLAANFGLRMLVQQPTFYRGETASRLDNILVHSGTRKSPRDCRWHEIESKSSRHISSAVLT